MAGQAPDDSYHRSEVRDGIRIDWHVPVGMDDGAVLRADVYRPETGAPAPAILTYGPYAKGLAFADGYPRQWEQLVREAPETVAGKTNAYHNWETVDPEKWVPDGYACVRVDSRGAGWSPGFLDVWSPRETRDLYECIEWAAGQPWCNGRVGLCGISYYAMNQWQVAGLQPPHLAAMVPWEGASDWYREVYYHGGILSEFAAGWYPRQVLSVQYGRGKRAPANPNTGESVAGPVSLPDGELAANRTDLAAEIKSHPLEDEWHRARSAQWENVRVPFLSAANWGGQGLHPRGNFEGFARAASDQKWLDVHGGTHFTCFYAEYGVSLQKRFLDYFLRDVANGWPSEPRVRLQIRYADGHFAERHEAEWPLARTQWTRWYLDPGNSALQLAAPRAQSQVSYDPLGDGVTFWAPAAERETEITGPLAAKLFISSATADADLFLVLRVFGPGGAEVVFQGSNDPHTPIAQGWLRASHRKLDPSRSTAWQPYHPHDERQWLVPGQVYELDVEIWPTCIVLPPGYRLALSVRGKDYEYQGPVDEEYRKLGYKGCAGFTHSDPDDRPAELFGGQVTLHCGGPRASYLLVPVIPGG